MRGQFEACACGSDQAANTNILKIMNTSEAECLGWEGVKREITHDEDSKKPSASIAPVSGQELSGEQESGTVEKGLAICLCVEGGPGTIGTVQVVALQILERVLPDAVAAGLSCQRNSCSDCAGREFVVIFSFPHDIDICICSTTLTIPFKRCPTLKRCPR